MRYTRHLAALALAAALILPELVPALASAAATSTESASSSSSTMATTTSTHTEAATTTADMSFSLNAATTSSATSTDNLSRVASSTDPVPTRATSTRDLTDSATSTNATTTPIIATSTATTTSDIPVSIGTASTSSATTSASTAAVVASSSQTVITGNAVALANILNILNATFINSQGSILFANFATSTGSVDLRNASGFSSLCDNGPCSGLSGLSVNLLDQSNLWNNISVTALSGGNTISNASSSAGIRTGDAFAGLNLVNLANVTLLGSNYLLVTLNAFQDVNGDIVFPSLAHFFDQDPDALASGAATSTNSATVSNNVDTSAESGDNTIANTDGGSVIAAGDSHTFVNVLNQLNSLLVGGGLSILVRVGGSWQGEVQGVPSNVSVATTSDGAIITATATGTPSALNNFSLDASSTAVIENDATVAANSGQNTIANASSSASIHTGDSYAAANVINVANQTIIGRNWLLAIVNVFGNFNGNIDFGQPDLWVGDSASAPTFIESGSVVHYTITVTNRGDADAHEVALTESFDPEHLVVATSSAYTLSGDELHFSLGNLSPGQSVQLSYVGTVKNAPPGTVITNHTNTTEHETDGNTADNADSVSVVASAPGGGSAPIMPSVTEPKDTAATSSESGATTTLSIKRVTDAEHAAPGETVSQRIVLTNSSKIVAHDVELIDILKDPAGLAMHEEDFAIGDVNPGDEVVITYDLSFGVDTQPGTYSFATNIVGSNVPSTGAVNGQVTLAPLPIALVAPVIPVSSTSTLSPHLTHVSVSNINQVVKAASSTAPVDMSQKRALLAAASTAAPDPGPIFASFYVLLVGSIFALAKKGYRFFSR